MSQKEDQIAIIQYISCYGENENKYWAGEAGTRA
jgi:hypothetical protein